MTVILGLAWFIVGLVFMVLGKDFDMVFKAFLLSGIFFISVNLSTIKTELHRHIFFIDKEELAEKGKKV